MCLGPKGTLFTHHSVVLGWKDGHLFPGLGYLAELLVVLLLELGVEEAESAVSADVLEDAPVTVPQMVLVALPRGHPGLAEGALVPVELALLLPVVVQLAAVGEAPAAGGTGEGKLLFSVKFGI